MSYITFNLQCIYRAFYEGFYDLPDDALSEPAASAGEWQEKIFTYIPEYFRGKNGNGPSQLVFVSYLFPEKVICHSRISVFRNKGRLSQLYRGQIVSQTGSDSEPLSFKNGFKNFFTVLTRAMQEDDNLDEMIRLCRNFLISGHYDPIRFTNYFTGVLQREGFPILPENDLNHLQTWIHSRPEKALAWFVLFAVLSRGIIGLRAQFFDDGIPAARLGLMISAAQSCPAEQFEPQFTLPGCVSNFCGRRHYLLVLCQLLQSPAGCGHHVFLYGMHGIGKTELAKYYAHKYRHFYDVILFIDDAESIRDVVCNRITLRHFPNSSFGENNAGRLFRQKLQFLQHISSPRVLFIIDNFTQLEDRDLEAFLSGEYSVIFTTTADFSAIGYVSLPVLPFELFRNPRSRQEQTFRHLDLFVPLKDFIEPGMTLTHFQNCWQQTVLPQQQQAVTELFYRFDGHPFLLELIGRQMRADRLTPQQMLDLLDKYGLHMPDTLSRIHHRSRAVPHRLYDYVSYMVRPENLTQREQYLLKNLAVMPLSGVPAQDFCAWCGLETRTELNRLISRSYVIQDPDAGRICLHPLIREIILCNMTPCAGDTVTLTRTLSRLIVGGCEQSCEKWSLLEQAVISLLCTLTTFSLDSLPAYDSLLFCCLRISQYDLAVQVSQAAYRFARQRRADHRLLGMLARSAGNSLYCSGSAGTQDCLPWFEMMLDHYSRLEDRPQEALDQILADLVMARFYIGGHQLKQARNLLDKAKQALSGLSDHASKDVSAAFVKGVLYFLSACLEISGSCADAALKQAQAAVDCCEKQHSGLLCSLKTAALIIKAKACTLKKFFFSARSTLDQVLRTIHQPSHANGAVLIQTLISMGDLECWKGELETAICCYQDADQIIRSIYRRGDEKFLPEVRDKLLRCRRAVLGVPLYVSISANV